jgi:hypothetical protein
MSLINVDLSDTITGWRTKTNDIATNLGDLVLLTTTDKDSLVDAINELDRRSINVYDAAGTLLNS